MWCKFYLLINWFYYVSLVLEMNSCFIGKKFMYILLYVLKIWVKVCLEGRENRRSEIKDFNFIFLSFDDYGLVIGECSKYSIFLVLKLEG